MTQEDSRFINSLRAVFRMPPLCQDGRGDARLREEEIWLPQFPSSGHVTPGKKKRFLEAHHPFDDHQSRLGESG